MTEQDHDTIRAGFDGLNREVRPRQREGDAPPWSLDTKYKLVGTRIPRIDAVAKVTGTARYPSDERPKGLVYAAILRSPVPAGTLARIDLTKALALPGVAGGLAAKEVGHKVRYQGDELCIVAATSRAIAEDALPRVDFEITPSEHDVDPITAARETIGKPDPLPTSLDEVGPAKTDQVTLKQLYETQTQLHHPLEPHGVTAWFKADGSLEVWASTQATFGMRTALARALVIPQNKVRVRTEYMGGGFGSKLMPGVEALLCARLSKQLGKPVHCFLDRRSEALAVGNRPASLQLHTVRANKDGKLLFWGGETLGFPGYAGRASIATSRDLYFESKPRAFEHTDVRGNTGAARPFRAPPHPQGFFASESIIDEIAYRIGKDPLSFRIDNLKNPLYALQLRTGADAIAWDARFNKNPGRVNTDSRELRGVGVAITTWGGQGGGRNQVRCRIHQNGRVEVRNGAQDIGTGTRTVLAIVTAETLGIPLDLVDVYLGDTNDPSGPASGGSTTAASISPTARRAAWLAGRELLTALAEKLGHKVDQLKLEPGRVLLPDGKPLPWKTACANLDNEPVEALGTRARNWRGFSRRVCGCQFAEVRVDLDTGHVGIDKIVAVQDCGTVVDTLTAESQVIGAVIQGIGFALYEERLVDPVLGRVVNDDLEDYRLPGMKEVPEIVPILMHGNNGHTNTGVVGLGEPPVIPTAAAIANAIRNATGVRMHRLPMTKARVLEGLERMKIGRSS